MTSKELIALMGCGRKYRLRALSLKGRNEKNLCFHAALGMLAKGMAKGAEQPTLLQEMQKKGRGREEPGKDAVSSGERRERILGGIKESGIFRPGDSVSEYEASVSCRDG